MALDVASTSTQLLITLYFNTMVYANIYSVHKTHATLADYMIKPELEVQYLFIECTPDNGTQEAESLDG